MSTLHTSYLVTNSSVLYCKCERADLVPSQAIPRCEREAVLVTASSTGACSTNILSVGIVYYYNTVHPPQRWQLKSDSPQRKMILYSLFFVFLWLSQTS